MYRPSLDDTAGALLALLPPGAAWQSGDLIIGRDKTVMRRLIRALATGFNDVELAIADLFDELFVTTAKTDLDLWAEDYGLPDACDPWGNNVVAKATATGEGRRDLGYYASLAAAAGWVADLSWVKTGGTVSTLHVAVNTRLSRPIATELALGNWELPYMPLGAPDPLRLVCQLAQVLPAHVAITYEVLP